MRAVASVQSSVSIIERRSNQEFSSSLGVPIEGVSLPLITRMVVAVVSPSPPPTSPPSLPPPLLPPQPPFEPPAPATPGARYEMVMKAGFKVAGDVATFDQDAFRAGLLTMFPQASSVALTVTPGSVNVEARLIMPSRNAALSAQTTLVSTPPSTLSANLGAPVQMTTPPVIQKEQIEAPSPPPPAPPPPYWPPPQPPPRAPPFPPSPPTDPPLDKVDGVTTAGAQTTVVQLAVSFGTVVLLLTMISGFMLAVLRRKNRQLKLAKSTRAGERPAFPTFRDVQSDPNQAVRLPHLGITSSTIRRGQMDSPVESVPSPDREARSQQSLFGVSNIPGAASTSPLYASRSSMSLSPSSIAAKELRIERLARARTEAIRKKSAMMERQGAPVQLASSQFRAHASRSGAFSPPASCAAGPSAAASPPMQDLTPYPVYRSRADALAARRIREMSTPPIHAPSSQEGRRLTHSAHQSSGSMCRSPARSPRRLSGANRIDPSNPSSRTPASSNVLSDRKGFESDRSMRI
jgi:hypothetical protein